MLYTSREEKKSEILKPKEREWLANCSGSAWMDPAASNPAMPTMLSAQKEI